MLVSPLDPVGQVLWEEKLVLSRFYSYLQAGEWNFCLLTRNVSLLFICDIYLSKIPTLGLCLKYLENLAL